MKFGLFVPNVGSFADPHVLLQVAGRAEDSGWDGFFVWDMLTPELAPEGPPLVADPLVVLSAAAASTKRIALGPMITPIARRRPHKVAREMVTLDHLSNGRLILGVGLGDKPLAEFEPFGENPDARERAEKLDEGLQLIDLLWSGERVTFEGRHFGIRDVTFLPPPIQRPRIPIWVGGHWPLKGPADRASRWDGMFPLGEHPLTPGDYREIRSYIAERKRSSCPFDLVHSVAGSGPSPDPQTVAEYERSGVTWWFRMFMPTDGADTALSCASAQPLAV